MLRWCRTVRPGALTGVSVWCEGRRLVTRPTRRRPLVLAALAALVVCTASARVTPRVAHAQTHSTIVVDYINDFSTLDTGKCYDTQCYGWMHAMYDQLIGYDTRRGTGDSFIPDAATALPTITHGGKTYTFALRHDVHFWNGRLVTSADWVYSFQREINPKTQSGAQSFWLSIVGAQAYANGKAKSVSGIKALGPFKLEIDLTAPYTGFLNVLAMPMGSVQDQYTIAKYPKTYDSMHPMGTGPYMFKQRILNQK